MNDLIVQFAILWGINIGSAITPGDLEIAECLKAYDSEEALALFTRWAEEYMENDWDDIYSFFINKLPSIINE